MASKDKRQLGQFKDFVLNVPKLQKSISVCYHRKNYRGYAPIFKEHLDPRKSKAEQLASELSEYHDLSERFMVHNAIQEERSQSQQSSEFSNQHDKKLATEPFNESESFTQGSRSNRN